mgnify:CR=1 FL=1
MKLKFIDFTEKTLTRYVFYKSLNMPGVQSVIVKQSRRCSAASENILHSQTIMPARKSQRRKHLGYGAAQPADDAVLLNRYDHFMCLAVSIINASSIGLIVGRLITVGVISVIFETAFRLS